MESRKKIIEEILASIHAMKNKMHVKIANHKKQSPVTHSQWIVLSIIETHKNLGIKEISEMLGITSSATTQLVDALSENGYVQRKISKNDRRSLQLCLSKKEQKSIKKMNAHYIATMKKMFDALTDSELEAYRALHKKILSNIPK